MSLVALGYYLLIYVPVMLPFSPLGIIFFYKFKKNNNLKLKVLFAILTMFFLFPLIILIIGVVWGING